jgi:hypothetical protein
MANHHIASALRIVFLLCMTAMVLEEMGFEHPILFVIGYVDVVFVMFFAWIGWEIVRRFLVRRVND